MSNKVGLFKRLLVNFYDLILLATDHDEFDYKLIEKESKLILDTRGRFELKNGVLYA